MSTETSPTARALLVLELLQNQPGATADDLAAALGVTERAARRYVGILREAEIPILSSEQRALEELANGDAPSPGDTNGSAKPSQPTRSKVNSDGTYATESALTSEASAKAKIEAVRAASKPPLRTLILDGGYYLATVLASTLTKRVMLHSEISKAEQRTNALKAEVCLLAHLVQSFLTYIVFRRC